MGYEPNEIRVWFKFVAEELFWKKGVAVFAVSKKVSFPLWTLVSAFLYDHREKGGEEERVLEKEEVQCTFGQSSIFFFVYALKKTR